MNSRRSFAPIAAMFTAIILTVGAGPRVVSAVAGRPIENIHRVAATEAVCLEFARVEEMLKSGQVKGAKALLDRIGGEPLVVENSTGGQGALEGFSPVTLLMQVTRQMRVQALKEARNGNVTEALSWVGRCRELAAQVLATPQPNLEALHTARAMDVVAAKAETEVYQVLNDSEGVAAATERERRISQFFLTTIHGRVDALPNDRKEITQDQIQALLNLYLGQRGRMTAGQAERQG